LHPFAPGRDVDRVKLSQIFYKNLFPFQQIPYPVAPVWEIPILPRFFCRSPSKSTRPP
jgi:hypothetical protein